jgi:hypothetical protein
VAERAAAAAEKKGGRAEHFRGPWSGSSNELLLLVRPERVHGKNRGAAHHPPTFEQSGLVRCFGVAVRYGFGGSCEDENRRG